MAQEVCRIHHGELQSRRRCRLRLGRLLCGHRLSPDAEAFGGGGGDWAAEISRTGLSALYGNSTGPSAADFDGVSTPGGWFETTSGELTLFDQGR